MHQLNLIRRKAAELRTDADHLPPGLGRATLLKAIAALEQEERGLVQAAQEASATSAAETAAKALDGPEIGQGGPSSIGDILKGVRELLKAREPGFAFVIPGLPPGGLPDGLADIFAALGAEAKPDAGEAADIADAKAKLDEILRRTPEALQSVSAATGRPAEDTRAGLMAGLETDPARRESIRFLHSLMTASIGPEEAAGAAKADPAEVEAAVRYMHKVQRGEFLMAASKTGVSEKKFLADTIAHAIDCPDCGPAAIAAAKLAKPMEYVGPEAKDFDVLADFMLIANDWRDRKVERADDMEKAVDALDRLLIRFLDKDGRPKDKGANVDWLNGRLEQLEKALLPFLKRAKRADTEPGMMRVTVTPDELDQAHAAFDYAHKAS